MGMWRWMERHVGTNTDGILKIQRVVQGDKNKLIRFDMWIRQEQWDKVAAAIRAHAPKSWRFKASIPWHLRSRTREHERVAKDAPAVSGDHTPSQLTFLSLNSGGINKKREELDMLVAREQALVVCLQETLLPSQGWLMRLKHFQTHQIGRADVHPYRGKRGLTTLVHASIPSYVLHKSSSGQALWVRAFPSFAPEGIVVGNVYVGHTSKRNQIIREEAKRFYAYSCKWPTVVMGDWNRPVDEVETIFSRLGIHVFRPIRTAGKSFFRGGKPISALDFALYDAKFAALGSMSHQVLRSCTMSDHAPYRISLRHDAAAPISDTPETRIRINGTAWWENPDEIALHNAWEPLKYEMENGDMSISEKHTRFIEATYAACKDANRYTCGPAQTTPQWSRTFKCPTRIVRQYKRAAVLREKAISTESVKSRSKLHNLSKSALRKARAEMREHRKNSWMAHVLKTTRLLVKSEAKKWWRITKGMMDNSQQVCPVVNDAGELVVAGQALMEAWEQHFRRLVTDLSAKSRNPDCWEDIPVKINGLIYGISDPFTWAEVAHCLKTSRSGRAVGAIPLPVEILKACVAPVVEGEDADQESGAPPNFMASCLLHLVNHIFKHGEIPEAMLEKWFVAIPKKNGDLTDRNNYRGIVLMDTLLKLISRLLAIRTAEGLEEQNRLCIEQGGFRIGKEVVAQIIALVEVLNRWIASGRSGFLIFVDIVKAFDRVPHEALFRKLAAMGVTGDALRFIRAEYAQSRMRVKTKTGVSAVFDQELGVHQGGPLSPIIFGVYINDILDQLRKFGCEVSGVDRLFIGLLFADDMVLAARTVSEVRDMLKELEAWGTQWEMTFGVNADGKKSAILPFGKNARQLPEKTLKRLAALTLGGKPVPLVKTYSYLGLPVTSIPNLSTIREHCLGRATAAFNAVRHLLGRRSLPTMTRVLIFNNVVVNSAMFGAELWGGVQSSCKAFDKIWRQGLNLCFGADAESIGTPVHAMAIDAGIPPFAVTTTIARLRLFDKLRDGKADNWLHLLINQPPKSGAKANSWVMKTSAMYKALIKRFGDDIMKSDDRICLHKLRQALWKAYELNSKSTKRVRRLNARYEFKPWTPLKEWMRLWGKFGGNPKLERYFWQLRHGSFRTAASLSKMGWVDKKYSKFCPMCETSAPETIDHYLFVCQRWDTERAMFLRRACYMFPSLRDSRNRVMKVLGRHPCTLASVNLADAYAEATEPWQKLHIKRRGWIRARGPLWGFLVDTNQKRQGILAKLTLVPRVSSAIPRDKALAVGPTCTVTNVAGGTTK